MTETTPLKFWVAYKSPCCGLAVEIVKILTQGRAFGEAFDETQRRWTPKQIASFACDVSAAIMGEMADRDWTEVVERPEDKP